MDVKNQAEESISPKSQVHHKPSKMYWKYEFRTMGKRKGVQCNNNLDDCKIWNITLKIDAGQRQKCKKKKVLDLN